MLGTSLVNTLGSHCWGRRCNPCSRELRPPQAEWEPIEKYINEQYEKFLKEEVNIARKKRIPDTRVHCCLYFISPTGHSYVPGLPPSPGLPLVCII